MSFAEAQCGILVVDDDEPVRRYASIALASAGYSVLDAGSGPEALRLLGDVDCHVKLLLTDIRMPGMDGIELASRVRREHPGIRILYMTGFSDAAVEPDSTVLHKPFSPKVLHDEVASSLGVNRGAGAPRPGGSNCARERTTLR